MADTIRRRLIQPDTFLDEQLESPPDAIKRARLRRLFRTIKKRQSPDSIRMFAERVSLSEGVLKHALSARFFGAAWAEVERQSRALARKPVLMRDLDDQTVKAVSILRVLRRAVFANTPSTHRGDTALLESDALA